jgi:zinc protease
MNRKQHPPFSKVEKIQLLHLNQIELNNGLQVLYTNTPNSGVIKLDLIFEAGLKNEKKRGVAGIVSAMLLDGTKQYPGKSLSNALDQLGAYIQPKYGAEDATITLYCLSKQSSACFALLLSIITESLFEDVHKEKQIAKFSQQLEINQMRTGYRCRKAFNQIVYGKDSPYGGSVNQEDYNSISRETLFDFYANRITDGLVKIMIAGDVNQNVIDGLKIFELLKVGEKPLSPKVMVIPTKGQKQIVSMRQSIQSTIRIGKQSISRNHPDFQKLALLNLILGGFFGSRLMKNIRERLGLTYGIYSSIESHINAASFFIEADLNTNKVDLALAEIEKELKHIVEVEIETEELNIAKNYFIGSLLRSLDGPFTSIERYKMLFDYGLPYDYYNQYVKNLWNISPKDLQEVAERFLTNHNMAIVFAGNH